MADQFAIAFPAPSVPSGSSEDAADQLSQHVRNSQARSILLTLSHLPAGRTLSRYEIHRRTGIAVTTLCARVKSDLQDIGLVEAVERARPSHAKKGLLVTGYRISDAGRRFLERGPDAT